MRCDRCATFLHRSISVSAHQTTPTELLVDMLWTLIDKPWTPYKVSREEIDCRICYSANENNLNERLNRTDTQNI